METKLFTDLSKADHVLTHYIIPFGWKIVGAFGAWVIGSLIIKATQKIVDATLNKKKIDPTLVNYAHSALGAAMRILLVVIILGIFGIETTSFSAILAAAGVAIGIAWSGLLANFAAGVFLIVFRPFKVGDAILAAGVTGTVREIGMFASTIDTDANVRVFVGNNKIFADNIINYTFNATRVVPYKVQLAQGVDPKAAIELLKQKLLSSAPAFRTVAVGGEISELNSMGTLITIKATCATADFAAMGTLGYQMIIEALSDARYPVPENKMVLVEKSR